MFTRLAKVINGPTTSTAPLSPPPVDWFTAAANGDVNQLRILRASAWFSIDAVNPGGLTALHLAASSAHVEAARFLLDVGADINSRSPDGWTVLHFAAESYISERNINIKVNLVCLLLERGVDVNAKDADGQTALHREIESTALIIRDTMMGVSDTFGSVRGKIESDYVEIINAHNEFTRLLLAYGLDFEAKDQHGISAVMLEKKRIGFYEACYLDDVAAGKIPRLTKADLDTPYQKFTVFTSSTLTALYRRGNSTFQGNQHVTDKSSSSIPVIQTSFSDTKISLIKSPGASNAPSSSQINKTIASGDITDLVLTPDVSIKPITAPRLTAIDLGASINDANIRKLATVIKYNPPIISLALDFNYFGDKGAQMLASALEHNSVLHYLNLRGNKIGPAGARAIAKVLDNLTTLELRDNEIGPEGARALAVALLYAKHLVTLDLERSQIGDDGAKALAIALEHNQSLTTLRLRFNEISSKGARAFLRALKRNTTLTTLDLAVPSLCSYENQINGRILESIKAHLISNRTTPGIRREATPADQLAALAHQLDALTASALVEFLLVNTSTSHSSQVTIVETKLLQSVTQVETPTSHSSQVAVVETKLSQPSTQVAVIDAEPSVQFSILNTSILPSYTEELIRRVLSISIGEDKWSACIAQLCFALKASDNLAAVDAAVKNAILNIRDALKQPFHYIGESLRAALIANYDANHPGVRALMTTRDRIQYAVFTHNWLLPAPVSTALNNLIAYYNDYLHDLATGDPATRLRLLTPKAYISGVDIGYHYVSYETAYALLCCNLYSGVIRANTTGFHPVAKVNDAYYKPNPGTGEGIIKPNTEHADVALYQLVAREQIAAATTVVKVHGVPMIEIPSSIKDAAQDQDAYQLLQDLRLSGEDTNTILTRHEDLRARLRTTSSVHSGCLIQVGYSIEGMCLLEVILLQESIKHLGTVLGRQTAEDLVDKLLQGGANFINATYEVIPGLHALKARGKQALWDGLFDAYGAAARLLPEASRLKEFSVAEQSWRRSFYHVANEFDADALILAYGVFRQYPVLMQDERLRNAVRMFGLLQKRLPMVIAPQTAAAAFDQVPRLLNTLSPEASSALMFGLWTSLPTDAKFDNFIWVYWKNAQGVIIYSYIVAIDNDLGLESLPLVIRDMLRGAKACIITTKNSLYFLTELMDLPFHQDVIQRLLSRSPLEWLSMWLSQIGKRDNACERWYLEGGINDSDIQRTPDDSSVDIPFRIAPRVVRHVYDTIGRLQGYLQTHQHGPAEALTLRRLTRYLYPEVFALYQYIAERCPNRRRAEAALYEEGCEGPLNIDTPISSPEAWQLISPIPLEEAFERFPAEYVEDEQPLSVRTMVSRLIQTLPWDEYPLHALISPIQNLVQPFPDIRLPLSATNLQVLLAFAIEQDAVETVDWLLRQGVSIEAGQVEGSLSALQMFCRHWRDHEPGDTPKPAAVAMLSLLLKAGANPNQRYPEGHTPIMQLLRNTKDCQAAKVIPLIQCLCEAGAILDLPDVGSGLYPLDKLMQWHERGQPVDGMPHLFATMVQLGARRVEPVRAMAFIQAFQHIPELNRAAQVLMQDHLGLAWQAMRPHLWVSNKPGRRYIAAELITQKGDKGYLHPTLAGLLLDTHSKTFLMDVRSHVGTNSRLSHASMSVPNLPSSSTSLREQANPAASSSTVIESETMSAPRVQDADFGRRHVKRIEVTIQGVTIKLHAKDRPELPSVGDAVSRLSHAFMSQGIVPSELIALTNAKGQRYPVLMTPTVEGYTLHEVLSNPALYQRILRKLDPESLSALLCFSMLINLEDGKADNFVVQAYRNAQGKKRYRIICVDPDHAFVMPIKDDKLQVKCILFCLDAMHTPVHPSVRAQLLALDPGTTLINWLKAVDAHHQQVTQAFSLEDAQRLFDVDVNILTNFVDWLSRAVNLAREEGVTHEALPIILNMPFPPKAITWLFGKLIRLQAALVKHPNMTHLELLHILEPELGQAYELAFANPTPQSRFRAILAQSEGLLVTANGTKTLRTSADVTKLMGIDDSDMPAVVQGDVRFSAKSALAELEAVMRGRAHLGGVAQALLAGNPQRFYHLALDEDKASIVKRIDWTAFTLADGAPDIDRQTQLLEHIIAAGIRFRALVIKDAAALTDDILSRLLKPSRFVHRIDVSGCYNLTDGLVETLVRHRDTLTSIDVSGLLKLTRITPVRGLLGQAGRRFPRLTRLRLNHCPSLTRIDIQAPALHSVQVTHGYTVISRVVLGTNALTHLNLSHANLPVARLQTLLDAQTNLQTLNLAYARLGSVDAPTLPTTLRALDISGMANMTNFMLPPALQSFVLDNTDVGFETLVRYLVNNPVLKYLSLQGCTNLSGAARTFFLLTLAHREDLAQLVTLADMQKNQDSVQSATADITPTTAVSMFAAFETVLQTKPKNFVLNQTHQPIQLWFLALQAVGIDELRCEIILDTKARTALDAYIQARGPRELILMHDVMHKEALANLDTLEHYQKLHQKPGHSCKVALCGQADDVDTVTWLRAMETQRARLPAVAGTFSSSWRTHNVLDVKSAVNALLVLPDGRLVGGANDHNIYLWDATSGACLQMLQGHKGKIVALTYSPVVGLVSGSLDTSIRIWNVAGPSSAPVIRGNVWLLRGLVTLADGRLVHTNGEVICIWSNNKLSNGEWDDYDFIPYVGDYWDNRRDITSTTGYARALAPLPDGKLACSDDNNYIIRVWDMEKPVAVLPGHQDWIRVLCALSGNRLASGSDDKTIRVWDLASENCKTVLRGHTGPIRALIELSNDRLVSGADDMTIRIWDMVRGTHLLTLTGHTGAVLALALLPDGGFASSASDNTIRFWKSCAYAYNSTYKPADNSGRSPVAGAVQPSKSPSDNPWAIARREENQAMQSRQAASANQRMHAGAVERVDTRGTSNALARLSTAPAATLFTRGSSIPTCSSSVSPGSVVQPNK